jgi:hypothetical protein
LLEATGNVMKEVELFTQAFIFSKTLAQYNDFRLLLLRGLPF